MRQTKAIRIVRRLLASSLWLIATLALVLWAIGRLASDRWLVTQYLYWVPTSYLIGSCAGLLVFVMVLGVGSRRERPRDRKKRSLCRRLATVHALPILLLLAGVFSLANEHHVLRFRQSQREPDLRIVFWNASNHPLDYPPTLVSEHQPDLAIVANPRWKMGREMLYTMVFEPAPQGERGAVLWRGGFAIASRWEILDSGFVSLGLEGVRSGMDPQRDGERAFDRGAAIFLELDTAGSVGRSTVVWILDLPSDPGLSRRSIVEKARSAISGWKDADGRGFPLPDIVVGDLNIPSGSWSLGRLSPGLVDAHDSSGLGAGRTWPREDPFWRIDHVRVRRPWIAVGSEVFDPGYGTHRMIVVDLAHRP